MPKAESCEKLTFQLQLLLRLKETKRYPFTRMVIEKGLSEQEYNEVIRLLEELNDTYERDQENGLLDHSPLLIHFAGMLPYQLPIEDSVRAMKAEGMYPKLTQQLLKLMKI